MSGTTTAARGPSEPALVVGSAGSALAEVAEAAGVEEVEASTRTHPDGELDVSIDPSVRNRTVFVLQSLGPPVNEHIIELLMLVDACRRAGATRVVAVIPYLAYARSDRRAHPGGAVGLAMMKNLVQAAWIDGLVVVDPHVAQVDAVFDIPLRVVSAVPWLDDAIDLPRPESTMVVSPDLGAVALAERHAEHLGVGNVAVVRKTRLSGKRVEVAGVAGESSAPTDVVVADDIISTGVTIEAAVEAVRDRWSPERVVVTATHALLAEGAATRLDSLHLDDLVVSDTIRSSSLPAGARVASVAPTLASAVRELTRTGR